MSGAKPLIMELTPAAERFIRRMMRLSMDAKAGFRLKVRPGGCSGFACGFDIAAQPASDEIVWEDAGLRIFLDGESRLLLSGATVDFEDSLGNTGFTVMNQSGTPQACGQGSAFVSVDTLIRR